MYSLVTPSQEEYARTRKGIEKEKDSLRQGCPTGSLWIACGPQNLSMRPMSSHLATPSPATQFLLPQWPGGGWSVQSAHMEKKGTRLTAMQVGRACGGREPGCLHCGCGEMLEEIAHDVLAMRKGAGQPRKVGKRPGPGKWGSRAAHTVHVAS